ncbi:unnamed protein product [Fusarium graminearum]|uniref:Chromosome 1, complete genome n=2 Tax=Gibberella zeae TaxID=5518 RepID=I1S4H2_GIBZE|nr:hypothetical protein FGSG_11739 [Fusarium graminearum PH-1]ESU05433.1 hypothetical protein FGSG_11739 [Fusarium graminearum PH-1]CAG1986058.1 unnamed protein product [Fusarium graminearum]CEF72170.1 unnamed protein product [Fusarium graminearum]CZS75432.1 unnamed protein product [Fusarium graminearum]|eukprot:XP_011315918.1 hypothetical protein FGSG_11739 [Fusarium graminearum PH-1]
MSHLSTDAIVTIISTIPGLLVSSLSAWFAYAAIRRRRPAASDIETSTIGLIMSIPVLSLTLDTAAHHLLLVNFRLCQQCLSLRIQTHQVHRDNRAGNSIGSCNNDLVSILFGILVKLLSLGLVFMSAEMRGENNSL